MNYTQAKLIANSPEAYQVDDWEQAASFLLGRLNLTSEDIDDGTTLANIVAEVRTKDRYGDD